MKVLDLYGVREVPVNPHVRSDGQDAPSVERPRARHRDSAHPWCRVRPSGRCPGHRGKVSAQSKVIEASPRSAMRLQKCRIRAIVSPSRGSFFFRTVLWREGARDPGCRPDLSPRPWMMAATPSPSLERRRCGPRAVGKGSGRLSCVRARERHDLLTAFRRWG